jgi:hypothetical protein
MTARVLTPLLALLAALVSAVSLTAAPTPAPAISGTTLDGKRLSLAALRGKPVLVNVWSSW